MERDNIAREIAARFNNGEGNITDLAAEYKGYSRHKFYRDIDRLGITKDEEGKYIIPDANIKGQLDLLEKVGPELEEKEILDPIGEEREGEKMQQDIKNKDTIADPLYKKKKTFEIDVELEQFIRVQAAIEDITINEWVNKILWKAIPEDTRRIVKE